MPKIKPPSLRTLALVFLLVFLFIAFIVKDGNQAVLSLDSAASSYLAENFPGPHPILSGISYLTDTRGRTLFAFILIGLFYLTKRKKAALAIFVSFALSLVLVALFKDLIGRERPPYLPGSEEGMSFPSGHVAQSIAIYGTLIYLIVRSKISQNRKRFAAWYFGIFLTLVAVSRVVLGAHWFLDGLAGALLGASVVFVSTSLIKIKVSVQDSDLKIILLIFLFMLTVSLFLGFVNPYPALTTGT